MGKTKIFLCVLGYVTFYFTLPAYAQSVRINAGDTKVDVDQGVNVSAGSGLKLAPAKKVNSAASSPLKVEENIQSTAIVIQSVKNNNADSTSGKTNRITDINNHDDIVIEGDSEDIVVLDGKGGSTIVSGPGAVAETTISNRKTTVRSSSRNINTIASKVFVNTDISNKNFSDAILTGSSFTNINAKGINLHNADLSRSQLTNVDFSKADLRGVNFTGAEIINVDLEGALLEGAIWIDGSTCSGNSCLSK